MSHDSGLQPQLCGENKLACFFLNCAAEALRSQRRLFTLKCSVMFVFGWGMPHSKVYHPSR